MKRMKRTILVLAVLLMLVSGAVTVYAVSEETGKALTPAGSEPAAQGAPADYAAEEMAVEAYCLDWQASQDAEMV